MVYLLAKSGKMERIIAKTIEEITKVLITTKILSIMNEANLRQNPAGVTTDISPGIVAWSGSVKPHL
jgi:hypothetical protein